MIIQSSYVSSRGHMMRSFIICTAAAESLRDSVKTITTRPHSTWCLHRCSTALPFLQSARPSGLPVLFPANTRLASFCVSSGQPLPMISLSVLAYSESPALKLTSQINRNGIRVVHESIFWNPIAAVQKPFLSSIFSIVSTRLLKRSVHRKRTSDTHRLVHVANKCLFEVIDCPRAVQVK